MKIQGSAIIMQSNCSLTTKHEVTENLVAWDPSKRIEYHSSGQSAKVQLSSLKAHAQTADLVEISKR